MHWLVQNAYRGYGLGVGMFMFLKRRKAELDARKKIGIELHRQIKEAFAQNESETSARLLTFFSAGYVYGFVRIGFFTLTGISGEGATDRHLRHICDGVLPNRLWENFDRKLRALEIAKGMLDSHTKLPGLDLTSAEAIRTFEDGTEIGMHDASFPETFRGNLVRNLRKYLVGELDVELLRRSLGH